MSGVELPLFADRHNHPYLYATLRAGLDLTAAGSIDEAVCLIRARLESRPPAANDLLLCYGWSSAFGELPLDDLLLSAPVVVFHRSLHQLQFNSAAAEILSARYPGEVGQLSDRNWFELNFQRVLNWFAGAGLTVSGLQEFFAWQRSIGIGYVEELLCCGSRELELFAQADLLEQTRFWASPETYRALSADGQHRIHGFKLFLDGALGSWTAALRYPYADRPDCRGLLLYEDYDLAELIYRLAPLGKGLAIHAIGDGATEQAVRICRQLGTRLNGFSEIRIEHAQLITPSDAMLARKMGIMLCLQPNFSIDSVSYRERLGSQRSEQNNPMRMLIDDVGYEPGIDLLFGTDGMPHGAEFAIEQGLVPPHPGQQLTLNELAAGFSGVSVSAGKIVCCFVEDHPQIEIIVGK
jgi:predicted amidohydrolase YtcJ